MAGDEVSRCGVAVAVRSLGRGHFPVGVQRRVRGLATQVVACRAGRVAGQPQQPVGDDDRARVDERVARDVLLALELDKGVERVAGGLPADALPQRVAAVRYREDEGEEFGDGLDGKRLFPVADTDSSPSAVASARRRPTPGPWPALAWSPRPAPAPRWPVRPRPVPPRSTGSSRPSFCRTAPTGGRGLRSAVPHTFRGLVQSARRVVVGVEPVVYTAPAYAAVAIRPQLIAAPGGVRN